MNKPNFERKLTGPVASVSAERAAMQLVSGSRVAVVGGGPAGSFFTYFLMDMARRRQLELQVDVYEPRAFSKTGAAGCNMCGGIVSESLVQTLAGDGILLPTAVVQRGLDSYVMHMDVGEVPIRMRLQEKRIAAVHRGAGPRDCKEPLWASFDGFLQQLTTEMGANVVPKRVAKVDFAKALPEIETKDGLRAEYDLVAMAIGVNTGGVEIAGLQSPHPAPRTSRTYICELKLGEELVEKHFGSSMHVFLLPIPRLEFAALIPKEAYVTLVMLGDDIDKAMVEDFLGDPHVNKCFPLDWEVPKQLCSCAPKINVGAAERLFADRLVFIGDCGASRLYKDGIGAAYRVGKAAAATAVFHGVARESFRKHYLPHCKRIEKDNRLGKLVFATTGLFKSLKLARHAMYRLVRWEQERDARPLRMSTVLWDTFTGSAPYRDILRRALHPALLLGLLWHTLTWLWSATIGRLLPQSIDATDAVTFEDGAAVFRQGAQGDCMYVIRRGKVKVCHDEGGKDVYLTTLGPGRFFGEMALFGAQARTASVFAVGHVALLRVDRATFLKRIHEDPRLAFMIARGMSLRLRELSDQVFAVAGADRPRAAAPPPPVGGRRTQLGRLYQHGEAIVRQGEAGDAMYVVQEGQVEVVQEGDGKEVLLGTLTVGDSFGELALVERTPRSATVRAVGEARVVTINRKLFLQRTKEDPSLIYRVLDSMARRIVHLSQDLVSTVTAKAV